jgi:hypothetical protein
VGLRVKKYQELTLIMVNLAAIMLLDFVSVKRYLDVLPVNVIVLDCGFGYVYLYLQQGRMNQTTEKITGSFHGRLNCFDDGMLHLELLSFWNSSDVPKKNTKYKKLNAKLWKL